MSGQGPSAANSRRVSVVIPAYRSAATIRRAVESVLNQTRSAAEIVVVDDGSPDDQAAVVEHAYGSRVTLVRQANAGAASARNAGLDRSTGDCVAFLDADDYWEPDKLARQLSLLQEYPSLGLVAGAYFEEVPGQSRGGEPAVRGAHDLYDRVLRLDGSRAFRLATVVLTTTVLITRDALGSNRFQPGLEPAEDRDLWFRIVARHAAYLTRRPVATLVLTEGSLSRSGVDRDKSNMLRVVERHRSLLGPIGSRVWRSYMLYSWASVDPTLRTAVPRLLASFAAWPLPFAPHIDAPRLARLKRMGHLMRTAIRPLARHESR